MNTNDVLYLVEALTTAFAIIIGLIVYEVKHKKFFIGYLSIVVSIFMVIFGVTIILEEPKMEVKELQKIEVKTEAEIEKPHTIYHYKDVTDKVEITGDLNLNKIGKYKVIYLLETLKGTYSKEATVIVVDTKKPEIILKGNEIIKQSYKAEYKELGYEAIDGYDGDITQNVEVKKQEIDENNYTLIYEVKDSSGNSTIKTRKITLIDDVAPNIALNGEEKIIIYLNQKYNEKGAKAEDEKDGDLTSKITTEGKVDTSKEGTYKITYKVSDSSGNEATKTRTVVVKKETVKQPTTTKQVITNTSSSGKKVIYLTFDDGPSSYTSKLLDILKTYNVKATFFVTSNGSDSTIKREYDEGHTVGLHTNSHNYSYVYSSTDNFFKDLYAVQARVERITGHKSYIMRFPGGSSNTISKNYDGGTKIMSYLTKEVINRGFRYYDWNVSSGDAGGTTSAEGVYRNVVNSLKSGTSVVLQHDIKKFSVEAVPQIIEYGLKNGYTFSKITESTPMVTHGVNN